MFSVCLFTGAPQLGGAPGGTPPPNLDKNVGQNLGQKMDKVLDKILDKHFGQTFWKLLEVGGAGGTPLAVTQEDCLVSV